MDKKALVEKLLPYSPANIFALSALGGAGGFGGMRLLAEALQQFQPQQAVQGNQINVDFPRPKEEERDIDPSLADGMHQQLPFSSPKTAGALPGLYNPQVPTPAPVQTPTPVGPGQYNTALKVLAFSGLPIGFLGAKALYDKYKDHETQALVDESKKKYHNELQMAALNSKMGSATPNVDSFCDAIADELNKQAGAGLLGSIGNVAEAATDALPNLWNHQVYDRLSGTSPATSQLADSPMVKNYIQARDQLGFLDRAAKLGNKMSMGLLHTGTVAAPEVIGTGAAAAMLGALLYANAKKRKTEQDKQYPTKVEYAA